METPETRYARAGDLRIAYQVFGRGERAVFIPPFVSNIDAVWDHEFHRRMFGHLGSFLQVLQFDKRGVGLSDRPDTQPTLDERIDDIAAVMDAVGWERAHVFGLSEGASMAMHFAAVHPRRVERLALLSAQVSAADVERATQLSGERARELDEVVAEFGEVAGSWGEDPVPWARLMAPSQVDNDGYLRWVNRLNRLSASPADFMKQLMNIPQITGSTSPGEVDAPTLLLHLTDDRCVPIGHARVLAEQIPDARLIEIPGADHLMYSLDNWRDVTDPVIEFFTGRRPPTSIHRRFAVILYSDIVGSTAQAHALGDGEWTRLLEEHGSVTHQTVGVHGGRVVKSTGDGALAVFDSPSAAVDAGIELRARLADVGLTIRAGLHGGEVEVHPDGDISGLAANLAARVEQSADDGAIFVSSTMHDMLLGGGLEFVDRGRFELKGFADTWQLYEVAPQGV